MSRGKAILALGREAQAEVIRLVLDTEIGLELELVRIASKSGGQTRIGTCASAPADALAALLRRALLLDEVDAARLLDWPAERAVDPATGVDHIPLYLYPLAGIAAAAENCLKSNGLGRELRKSAEGFSKGCETTICKPVRSTRTAAALPRRPEAVLAGGERIRLEPGEAWSDAAIDDLARMKEKLRQDWDAPPPGCQTGGRVKYSECWRKSAEPLVKAVGFERFKKPLFRWFPLVDKPRTQAFVRQNPWELDQTDPIVEQHVELLRGLVWCCGLREDAELPGAFVGWRSARIARFRERGHGWCRSEMPALRRWG